MAHPAPYARTAVPAERQGRVGQDRRLVKDGVLQRVGGALPQAFSSQQINFSNSEKPPPDTRAPCIFPPARGGSSEAGVTARYHPLSLEALRQRVFRRRRRGPVRGVGGGGNQEHVAGAQGACGRRPAAHPVAKCATARVAYLCFQLANGHT